MDIETYVQRIIDVIVTPGIRLLLGVAVIVFIAGVVRYIANGDNAEERKKGAQHMLWGFVGFFIIYSADALVTFIENSINP